MRLQQEEELSKTFGKKGHALFQMQILDLVCASFFFFQKYCHPSLSGGVCMTHFGTELKVTKVVCHMIVLGCSVLRKSSVCVCICD